MGSFQKFCLRWNNHSSNFVGNLGLLLTSEEYSDVTVCCQGEVWHLHQLVLSASSSHFAQLLRLTPPGQTPILILDGPPANDVHALIHFIYHGEVNVDQDSLPSLLRTAASLRIKGLADVTGLTQELSAESLPVEGEVTCPVSGITGVGVSGANGSVTYDEMSPLNLSCNKTHHDFKEEIEANDESQIKIPSSNPLSLKHNIEKKRNSREEISEVSFHPSKRVRMQDSPSVVGATTVAIIAPIDSQTPVSDTVYTPLVAAHLKCKNSPPEPHENVVASTIDSFSKKDPSLSKPLTISKQQVVEKVRILPSKGPTTSFYNVPGSASFPLLNMALSPHIAYQQSSTTQTNLEVIRSDHTHVEVSAPISSICDLSQTSDTYEHKSGINNGEQNVSMYEQTARPPVQDVTTSVAIYSPPGLPSNPVEICSSNVSEQPEKLKTDEKVVNQNVPLPTSNIEENNVSQLPEKTFNHKKFSPCTIPNSNPCKKTVHIVRGVYPVTTDPYGVKKETVTESSTMHSETPVKNFSPEILIQSPNVVKLTPVAVTSYPSNINNTFPTNSIIYTASSGSPFKSCETPLSSTPPTNSSVHSNSKGNIPPLEEKQNVLVPLNSTPQDANDCAEVSCSSSTAHPTSSVMTSTESSAQNTQRVTINMRTFKEEWRRQLLVDYDSRTNMSICMLCFTTFKSYDGPRKNTYVKHAKRFHPALEDYSDEERGVIISMYEKYHKYDIDMQKEINKSFRATNNSGSSLKRVKISESGLPIASLSTNHTIRGEAEGGESSEERGTDSGSESKSGENCSVSRETGSLVADGTSGVRTSEKDSFQDMEISLNNNNNNSLSENNNKRKTEYQHRDTTITS